MSNTIEPVGPAPAATDHPNRYTADVQEAIQRLRAITEEIIKDANLRPLTLAETRLARATDPAALEKAAAICEGEPGVDDQLASASRMRDALAYVQAFESLRDEYVTCTRLVDQSVLCKKLDAVKEARVVYRLGKGMITAEAGDALRPKVEALKNALVRPRRKRKEEGSSSATPEATAPATAGAAGTKK